MDTVIGRVGDKVIMTFDFTSLRKTRIYQIQTISSFVYADSAFDHVTVTAVLVSLLPVCFNLRCFRS